jgi:hypothetical protein
MADGAYGVLLYEAIFDVEELRLGVEVAVGVGCHFRGGFR